MIKRKLLLTLFLLNIFFFVNINASTENYVPRIVNIDRSTIPKNILIGSYVGGRSHLKPMLDVAAILIERGYNVTLLTPGNYTPASEYPTVKQLTLGPLLRFKDFKTAETSLHTKEFRAEQLSQYLGHSLETYNRTFEIYKNIAKDYNIDLFFCDLAMNDVCFDSAHSLKKPAVGFVSVLALVAQTTYKSDPMFGCKITLENESLLERLKCSILKPLSFAYHLYPFTNKLNDIRKQLNVEPSKGISLRSQKISLTLVDTFFGLELPQDLPPNIQDIGPVLPKEYPPLTPELSDFMNNHERVLYVSFGTLFFMNTENNNKILQTLVEVVNKNLFDGVIWPLVVTSKSEFDSTITLTDGTKIRTSTILNNEHPHIKIVKFAPQFAVLNHTNTKLFFSHGGAGSVHESLYIGKPLLVLPLGGDHMGISEKLEMAGVSLTLNKFDLNVNDIINKMELLLKDNNIKKSLKRLEVLTKINSKRKYRGADLIEYILHSSGLNDDGENVNEEFLKEWVPANTRMGFIRGNNYDVLLFLLSIFIGFVGGISWILFRFIIMITSSSQKSKRE